jgi:hypothetical protein
MMIGFVQEILEVYDEPAFVRWAEALASGQATPIDLTWEAWMRARRRRAAADAAAAAVLGVFTRSESDRARHVTTVQEALGFLEGTRPEQ